MKKILFVAAACVLLTGCVKIELGEVDSTPSSTISSTSSVSTPAVASTSKVQGSVDLTDLATKVIKKGVTVKEPEVPEDNTGSENASDDLTGEPKE